MEEVKVNIFMMPTKDSTDILMLEGGLLEFSPNLRAENGQSFQNLYAISDETIPVGSSFMTFNSDGEPIEIQKCTESNVDMANDIGKRLVATTDYMMLDDSTSEFSADAIKDFIEKFNDHNTAKLNREQYLDQTSEDKLYIFNSNRSGVSTIKEHIILDVKEGGKRITSEGIFMGKTYTVEGEPTSFTLFGNTEVEVRKGLATGDGDLWHNSKFVSLNRTAIAEAREIEDERIKETYQKFWKS